MIIKEIKMKERTREEIERAKREALHEPSVLSELGDHPGLPIYLAFALKKLPFTLFSSTTYLKAKI